MSCRRNNLWLYSKNKTKDTTALHEQNAEDFEVRNPVVLLLNYDYINKQPTQLCVYHFMERFSAFKRSL